MQIEDDFDFPRFNMASTTLKDAEDRFLRALKSGNKAEIVAARLDLMAALDEYSKVVGTIANSG